MNPQRPSDQEVTGALGRILSSDVFARSDRARKLLDYLVRAELDGRAERLKGFSIAVDVFGKDADFDPATDAVVRVQAGRLRELLDQYYEGQGAGEQVRIAVPKGTYVPVFAHQAAPAPDGGPASASLDLERMKAAIDARFGDSAPPSMPSAKKPAAAANDNPGLIAAIYRHIKLFRVGLAFIILMLGFVSWRVAMNDTTAPVTAETTASTPRGARGAVTADMLPTVRLIVEPGAEAIAARLRAALPAFDTINFVNAAVVSPTVRPDEFAVRAAPGASPETTSVQIEHLASGRIVVSRSIGPVDAAGGARDFANLLDTGFPASGAIYAFIAENDLTSSLTRCLTLENRFYLDLKAEDHAAAYDCFSQLAQRGAKSPLVWAELANLQVSAVTGKFIHLPDASLDTALKFARKGVELGPGKATAYRALGFVLGRAGDASAGLDWMRKALDANPNDMSLAASAGNAFVMAGEYAAGVAQLDRAVHVTPLHPHWWDYALFLGAFMTGEKEKAWRASDALADSDRRHYVAARLVAAHERGDPAGARALASTLKAKSAGFATDPEAAFRDAQYPEELAHRLGEAIKSCLAAAGAV